MQSKEASMKDFIDTGKTRAESDMTIEKIVSMLEDCSLLSNSKKEAEKLKKEFIKNFKKERRIIDIDDYKKQIAKDEERKEKIRSRLDEIFLENEKLLGGTSFSEIEESLVAINEKIAEVQCLIA